MKKITIKIIKYSALLITIIGLASGCASTETTKMLEDNQKATARVAELANQAIDTANTANRKADAANRKADNADAAMNTARDAMQCCEQLKEETNRAYRKSMNK